MSSKEDEKCCKSVEQGTDSKIALIKKDIQHQGEKIDNLIKSVDKLTAKISNGMSEKLAELEVKVDDSEGLDREVAALKSRNTTIAWCLAIGFTVLSLFLKYAI